jgi:glycosyltransferase involved in cell wall biosynthesis
MGLKIAQIVCTYPPYKGGMGGSVKNFSKYLERTGQEITVFTPLYKHQTAPAQELQTSGVLVRRIKPFFSFGNSAILLRLWPKLQGFDIIHLHYPFYGTAELVALKKLLVGPNFKLIVHYHMDNRAKGLRGLIYKIARNITLPFVLAMADEITCASMDYIKHSDIGKYWNKHKSKFTQVSFGVDTNVFHHICEKDNKTEKNILFVGSLDTSHYFKGVENLIKAFKKISIDPQANLWIVGQGNMGEYYQQIAKDLQILERVQFIDDADTNKKLACLYSKADVLVLPSINRSEAFGLVLLEAMACGTPVVASNLPGVRSVFNNGHHGLTVKPNDIDDLTEKIIAIINHPQRSKNMGEAAKTLVHNKYTWEKVAEKLNNIYYRVRYVPTKEKSKIISK